ncbi:MAG: biotin transporter BioY [Rhodothermales bacterium]
MHSLFQVESPRHAIVDALRQERASAFVQAAGIVGFALLTALGAQARIYIWEVPFTLQSLAIYGSGLYLGWRGGLLSQLLYLAIGMVFPVFAGEGYGFAYLASAASAGYLIGAPLAAAVVGRASRHWNTLSGSTIAMLLGSLTLFAFGVTWLHYAANHATWSESIVKGWLSFLPVDLAKILFVSLVYTGTRRFWPERPVR